MPVVRLINPSSPALVHATKPGGTSTSTGGAGGASTGGVGSGIGGAGTGGAGTGGAATGGASTGGAAGATTITIGNPETPINIFAGGTGGTASSGKVASGAGPGGDGPGESGSGGRGKSTGNPNSYASSGARSPRDGRAESERITADEGGKNNMARKRFHLRRSRRSRNPFGASMSETAQLAAWALAGGIGTATLPAMFLKEKNIGAMGYAGNAASAFALSWLADRFAGPRAAQGAMVGGVLMIMGRAIQDFMGKNLLAFGQLGAYTPAWFYPPGTSQGLLQVQNPSNPFPTPAIAASGTGAAMAGLLGRGARMRSRYAR